MKHLVFILLILTGGLAYAALVPFYTDQSYQRDEPVVPWFIHNSGTPSTLYLNGVFQSQESGTNDLNLCAAWQIHSNGVSVGIVDSGSHGQRSIGCVQAVSPLSEIHYFEMSNYYGTTLASGVSNLTDMGCRVIVLETGSTPEIPELKDAILYCRSKGGCLVYPVPNGNWNLDTELIDHPYEDHIDNVLAIQSTDRSGQIYYSCSGTNCLAAPGRNIVSAGTYSSGTSWAAPIAAGCLAILIDRFPNQTPAQYMEDLRATASPVGQINLTAALMRPVPWVEIKIHGLDGWNYMVQSSTNLTDWQDGGTNGIDLPAKFYRAKI